MEFIDKKELGPYMNFTQDKGRSVYNWFFYKEAYSKKIVDFAIKNCNIKNKIIFDPFCGVATTLLCAKENNIPSYGYDANPMSVFISKTKTDNYSENIAKELEIELEKIEEIINSVKTKQSPYEVKEAMRLWKFDLFKLTNAFKKFAIKDIYYIREYIFEMQQSKIKNLLLLALLSSITECSFVKKDGGVLKPIKKNIPSPFFVFKKRIKKIINSIKKENIIGLKPKIEWKNSILENPPKDINLVITSPPYLNNINYLKIYSLELGLFAWGDKSIIDSANEKMMTSYIKEKNKIKDFTNILDIKKEIKEDNEKSQAYPEVISEYFLDTYNFFENINKVLQKNSEIYYIVSNSVLKNYSIEVDKYCAKILKKMNFDVKIYVGQNRIADVSFNKIKTRESLVFAKKI